MTMANIPNVRFKEFADDWEQRKLGELGTLKNGMNFSKDAMGHGYAFVNLQNIFGNSVVDVQNLGLAEASEKQLMEYSLLKGDVLFVRSSVKLEGVGEAALVPENLKDTTYSGFIIRFRDEYGLNDNFKTYVFGTKKVRDQIMAQATNSANKNISQTVLENLTFDIPSYEEQKEIGEYFKHLDHLITLHQHKCDEVKQLKKFMLQKMFPKNGELIPEIRFAGFTGNWEQRNLDAVSDVRDGTHDSPIYQNDGHPFVTSKNVKNGFINYDDVQYISDEDFEEINKRSKVDVNDILMGMIGTIGNLALIRTEPDFAIKNVALIKDTKQISYLYLYHYLQSKNVEKQLFSGMDGGTQKFLALNKIRELNILLPSKDEQLKIGEFLENLDHLITLHQHKCDQLKEVKRFMLQNMFPQKG